jgi:hypothetical protein
MKSLAMVALLAVAGVAIWKHRLGISVQGSLSAGTGTAETSAYPSGVSEYSTQIAPQLRQQVLAAQVTHEDQVTPVGFAPAFGPDENTSAHSRDSEW